MKTILKLLLTAAIANAGWHVASVWLTYFRFKDAVNQASQFSTTLSPPQLERRVLDIASQYSVPITDDNLNVRRDTGMPQHTYVDGTYQEQIELFPRVIYPWTFEVHVDTFSEISARP
jgi:hypothetical protein